MNYGSPIRTGAILTLGILLGGCALPVIPPEPVEAEPVVSTVTAAPVLQVTPVVAATVPAQSVAAAQAAERKDERKKKKKKSGGGGGWTG